MKTKTEPIISTPTHSFKKGIKLSQNIHMTIPEKMRIKPSVKTF